MKEEKNKVISPFTEPSVDERFLQLDSFIRSHNHDGRETRNVVILAPTILTGVAAPTSTPKKIGDIFIDTALAQVYMSTGNSSSGDWTLLN